MVAYVDLLRLHLIHIVAVYIQVLKVIELKTRHLAYIDDTMVFYQFASSHIVQWPY